MVKLIFLCRRRPGLTPAQYAERLLRGHVPLALRHHPAMRGYVVNLVEQVGAGMEALDSIGELTFERLDDFENRLYDGPEGRAAIERDVAGFLRGADAYVTTPHMQLHDAGLRATGRPSPRVQVHV